MPEREAGRCSLGEISAVEVYADPGSDSVAERVVLITSQGNIPLTRHFSGAERHEKNAAAIREWLRRRRGGRLSGGLSLK